MAKAMFATIAARLMHAINASNINCGKGRIDEGQIGQILTNINLGLYTRDILAFPNALTQKSLFLSRLPNKNMYFRRCENPFCNRAFQVNRFTLNGKNVIRGCDIICPHCGIAAGHDPESVFITHALSSCEEAEFDRTHPVTSCNSALA